MPSVGIDLGTTNSCVAVLEDGTVEILANDYGKRTTPSFVAFSKNNLLIGDGAKLQQKDNPSNTIFGVKRLIGRDFMDKNVQEDRKAWPFHVFNDHGRPKIWLSREEDCKILSPELISAMVLKKMKDIAHDRIGAVVPRVVITVPAYFTGAQRNATIDAAKVADLPVVAIINEPTAAALAYGIQRKNKSKRTVLVYDLGGGTFDVTLLTIKKANFEVIASGGDTHLGGDDFINAMVNHLAEEFKSKRKIDIRSNKRAMMRLREKCELTMKNLSVKTIASDRIHIDALAEGKDFTYELTRACFEKMNQENFLKTFDVMRKVLTDGRVADEGIDDVLLIGGASRIPYLQNALKDRFGEKIRQDVNPEEAVAYGAAVYAAYLSGETIPNVKTLRIQDVTPLSLGVELKDGRTSFLIKRNTSIPVTKKDVYHTTSDNQTVANIQVCEGESDKFEENHRLGGFELNGIPKMKAGQAHVVVEFSVNKNGVLHVSAFETTEKCQKSIVVKSNQRGFTDGEIRNTKQSLENFMKMSEKALKRQSAWNELQDCINDLQQSHESEEVSMRCGDAENWMKDNEGADIQELSQKLKELRTFADALSK